MKLLATAIACNVVALLLLVATVGEIKAEMEEQERKERAYIRETAKDVSCKVLVAAGLVKSCMLIPIVTSKKKEGNVEQSRGRTQ